MNRMALQSVLQIERKQLGDLCAVAAVVNQNDLFEHLFWRVLDDAPNSSVGNTLSLA